MDDYFARLDAQLAELTRRGAHLEPDVDRHPRRRFRPLSAIALVGSAAVAFLVAAILLSAKSGPPQPVHPSHAVAVPGGVTKLETQLAVLRRPQTAKDRSLPALVRSATQLGGLGEFGKTYESQLDGAIPSLTRFIETLPDTRDVFLVVYTPSSIFRGRPGLAPPRAVKAFQRIAIIGLMIVQPDGRWVDGQPIIGGEGGATAGGLYFEARHGPNGCSLQTLHNIVPDRVKRVVWQFPRQDSYGYVYKAPLTINIPVVNNVAIVTDRARASCDQPTVVTLYGANGRLLSRIGNPATLDRITHPIRHGHPGPPPSLLDGRFGRRRH